MKASERQALLDRAFRAYNRPNFIPDDPISIPHRFTLPADQEIAGLFAAILAWGNRKSIIRSCDRLLEAMDNAPYAFICGLHDLSSAMRQRLKGFVHRTFNELDLWHILEFLHHHYAEEGNPSLETAFTLGMKHNDATVEGALTGFHDYVFGFCAEAMDERHCRKHIATPERGSACKRLNMYLRWMVRRDDAGVDFGHWKNIRTDQLVCPLDVHAVRVARKLGLLQRQQVDWKAALELTEALRKMDLNDPVKYDFALFGLGVSGEW